MLETWRWFGPLDDIRLDEVRQTGAAGIVTALHEIPYGEVWPVEAIRRRQELMAASGFPWSVVESLPVHERIKLGEGPLEPLFDAYRQSLRNLAACGVRTVCYNFMPVIDWTRTDLSYPLANGATALRFDAVRFAAFDVFMLQRAGAEASHSRENVAAARRWFDAASESDKDGLLAAIMAGLPGAYDRYDIDGLRVMLARYEGIDAAALRANLVRFLQAVVPTAEEAGIKLCIHPDDPPRPLMGLPRIVSTHDDLSHLINAVPSPANGVTFCTGSLGAGADNDVPAMAQDFAPYTAFAHLRNVSKESDGSFHEADHLGGDTDMVRVVRALLEEEERRRADGREDWQIPFRPDHGHVLLSDAGRKTHPGYTLIGRMKGLAELRGVIAALSHRDMPLG
jgi:mannonate dehydratase